MCEKGAVHAHTAVAGATRRSSAPPRCCGCGAAGQVREKGVVVNEGRKRLLSRKNLAREWDNISPTKSSCTQQFQ